MTDVLLISLLALNVIGGVGLVRWLRRTIGALQGTVQALQQAVAALFVETLKTVRGLNATVLEIFKAMDPERWAKEVQVHKQLADQKVQAILEGEHRRFEREKAELSQQGKEAVAMRDKDLLNYLNLVFDFMPFVPRATRTPLDS